MYNFEEVTQKEHETRLGENAQTAIRIRRKTVSRFSPLDSVIETLIEFRLISQIRIFTLVSNEKRDNVAREFE